MKTPNNLLKFVRPERIDIIKDGFIRFTPPMYLNDPFEVNPVIIPHDEYNLNLMENGFDYRNYEFNKEDEDYSWQRFNDIKRCKDEFMNFSNEYGVLSLSSSIDMCLMPSIAIFSENDPRRNLLMWSHYTDDHKGFIIEFRQDFMDKVEILKIEYEDERPMMTQEEAVAGNLNPFFVKGTNWKYEKEWRIVQPLNMAQQIKELKNGEKAHLFKIKKSGIASITTGCKMPLEKVNELKQIVFNDPDLSGCRFYISKINNENFSLDFREYHSKGWTNDDIYGIPTFSRFPSLIKPS